MYLGLTTPNTSRGWKKVPQPPVLNLSSGGGPSDSDIDNDFHEGLTITLMRGQGAQKRQDGGKRTLMQTSQPVDTLNASLARDSTQLDGMTARVLKLRNPRARMDETRDVGARTGVLSLTALDRPTRDSGIDQQTTRIGIAWSACPLPAHVNQGWASDAVREPVEVQSMLDEEEGIVVDTGVLSTVTDCLGCGQKLAQVG